MAVARTLNEGQVMIRDLVAEYEKDRDYYRSSEFDELANRTRFIDKFFEALGWNVGDLSPRAEVLFHNRYRRDPSVAGEEAWDADLTEEQLDARASHTDVLDYLFRVGTELKFCVEAKRPSISVSTFDAVFQVKTYAWNQSLPFGVLTSFERMRVFATLVRPDRDKPSAGEVAGLALNYTEYVGAWPRIWQQLSREAVVSGAAAAAAKRAVPRGAKPVDDAFLEDLEGWRTELGNDLVKRHPDLEMWQLEEATQRIVDRLVFTRVIEDRDIEPEVVLRRYSRISDSYRRLSEEFRRLDAAYNGQLFAEHYSEDLEVSDRLIQSLIASLYSLNGSPYRFNEFGADFLGKVYERFLGTRFERQPNGTIRLVQKPEVRQAGGVFYTPRWVVDHMVEQSLAPLVTNRSPAQVAKVKVVDPACGSGTFLLGVLDYLIGWHEQYYDANPRLDPNNHYIDSQGRRRLTTDFKGQIVVNNVHGVDIDPRAVEVAQISLYLRILEEETASTLSAQPRLFQGAHLPTLSRNIRAGNSLIKPRALPAEVRAVSETLRRINPFDWHHTAHGFGAIFNDRGGFDVVIGNPPYTRVQTLARALPDEVAILGRAFRAATGSFDIASLFIEQGLEMLADRPPGRGLPAGTLCFITSRGVAETLAATPVRQMLANGNHVASIVDFGAGLVFAEAAAYTVILSVTQRSNKTWRLTRVPDPPSADALTEALDDTIRTATIPSRVLNDAPWSLMLPAEQDLLNRLAGQHPSLQDVSGNSIFQGVITGGDGYYRCVDTGPVPGDKSLRRVRMQADQTNQIRTIERRILRPVVAGRTDLQRFWLQSSSEWIIFPYNRSDPTDQYSLIPGSRMAVDFPHAWKWLSANEDQLRARKPSTPWTDETWHGYSRRQNLEKYAHPKVMVPSMTDALCAVYDKEQHYFINVSTGGYGLGNDASYGASPEYVAALLNSNLLSWILKLISRAWRGGYFEAKKANLSRLPIVIPDSRQQQVTVELYQRVCEAVGRSKESEGDTALARTAETARQSFDRHVDDLYQLSFVEQDLTRP